MGYVVKYYAYNGTLVFTVADCQVRFQLMPQARTWEDAAASCKSTSGRLAILDNLELQAAFGRQLVAPVGEPIWVGRYLAYTGIMAIHGTAAITHLTMCLIRALYY